ncbi:MAG: 30S ribosomal protein S3 [Planctomycetota bacterium]|jgi:small subunit ribosomal protein S3|nr:30S ribosomal protein S3 [Planctomycetota bacterium]
MGQKVHPTGFRIGITESWRSRWYAPKRTYGPLLVEDEKIRRFIKKNYGFAAISKIEIERTREEVKVILHSARPGLIIGRKGAEVDRLREQLEDLTGRRITVSIVEVVKAELSAQLVAENVAQQLEKRAAFRRTMKQAVDTTMAAGALGVKIRCAGRLGGAEMSRSEVTSRGSIPLHTLRAHIDYGFAQAHCTYGVTGVKAWVYLGEYAQTPKEAGDGDDA